MTIELKVEGMSCQMCVSHVQKALESVPGVTGARIWLEQGRAEAEGDNLDVEALKAAVEEEGYAATVGA